MTNEDLRRALPRPEILKMQIVMDGLMIGTVGSGRVIVEPVKPTTALDEYNQRGFITVPDAIREEHTPQPSTGIIVKCAADVSPDLYPGMMVAFSKYAGTRFMIDKKDLIVLHVADIAMTLEVCEGKALGDLVQRMEPDTTPDVPVLPGRALL